MSTPFLADPERFTRSDHAMIRVYDDAGNVIETHEHKGELSPIW